jgi:hypothetical protein
MRTIDPQPGYVEADVNTLLATRQFVFADCYTITPISGDVMRYTTAQRRVHVVPFAGGPGYVTYEANNVIIEGLRSRSTIGIEADEQQVELSYPPNDTSYQNYLSWAFALQTGRLDGATITRDRFFAATWTSGWIGSVRMFSGLVSTLKKVGRSSATMNVKSDLIKLNMKMPRDLWEPNCRNTLGDAACGVDLPSYATVGTVGASPTRSMLPWAAGDAHFSLGKVYIDNGDAVVRIRTIVRWEGGNIYLAYPLDFDPYAGQTFTAYPGCPRTTNATYGCPHYHVSWQDRFRGFPRVPVPETAF